MGLPLLAAKLLNSQTALNDTATVRLEKLGIDNMTHHISWSAGVLTGEVTIEVASEFDFPGQWAPLGVITFAGAAPREDILVTNLYAAALRHRITSPVVGGSVTSKVMASD